MKDHKIRKRSGWDVLYVQIHVFFRNMTPVFSIIYEELDKTIYLITWLTPRSSSKITCSNGFGTTKDVCVRRILGMYLHSPNWSAYFMYNNSFCYLQVTNWDIEASDIKYYNTQSHSVLLSYRIWCMSK